MSILETIRARKVEEVATLKAVGLAGEFAARIRDIPPAKDFTGAITTRYSDGRVALIAEIKRQSPSKGVIRSDRDVASVARAYRNGNAACLSVLTDTPFFGGRSEFVTIARETSGLPVLRKDFLIDPIQISETRAIEADAILLILAILEDTQARELEAAAMELGLHVIIEVHNEEELDRALSMNAPLIGINNRDLKTFEADLDVSVRLSRKLGPDRHAISESGIAGPVDAGYLVENGIRGFLIGEALMKSPDIADATKAITSLTQYL